MANDPDNSKYQQYRTHLQQVFQSRLATVIIVAIAVVTAVAIVIFVKALLGRSRAPSPSSLTRSGSESAMRTQTVAQLSSQQQPEGQPGSIQSQSQTPTTTTPPAASSPAPSGKEIRTADEARSAQGLDSLRTLSSLQQKLDLIKQEQEKQIQTIASQLELITRQQETSLQAASRMAAQILDLSQKAAAVSTQHQESVKAIAALETKIGNSQQAQEASTSSTPSLGSARAATGNNIDNNTANPAVTATATPRLSDLHLFPGVSTTALGNGGLQLKFDPAIFDRDDHFKIGAKTRLRDVAKELVQSQEQFVVQVVGVASGEPNTWPWLEPKTSSEMALLRACRVSTYLESLGIFPPGAILPRAGTADDLPFPAGDINNRTVLLRIFPRAYVRYIERK